MPLSRTSPFGIFSTDRLRASRNEGIIRQKNVLSAMSR